MASSTHLLRLPTALMEQAEQLAEASGSSLDQFLLAAIAEKVGVVQATLRVRAERADVAKAKAVLDSVPEVPPMPGDEP